MELKDYVVLRRVRREEEKRQVIYTKRTILCMTCMKRTNARCKVCSHCESILV